MLDELVDRFGEPPQPVMNLLTIAMVKAKAHEAFITSIAYKNEQLKIEMADGVRIKMELIENLIVKYMNNIRIVSGEKSGFVVDMPKKNLNGFIERLEEIVADIDGLIDRD
jgi:transcription-repair coupling factor (superfamily II helicase)